MRLEILLFHYGMTPYHLTLLISQKSLLLTYMTRKKSFKIILYAVLVVLIDYFIFCLKNPLFQDPYATVLEDQKETLIAAKIATDGQWRFPKSDHVPEKFKQAILHFEDEYFPYHPGVNPLALFRALKQNLTSGEVVSGGSTLTMQVIRLSRKGKSRTYFEKIVEIIQAIRLELTHSKQEVLSLYTAHAPFGGNVVGLDAAAWRYYGRPADQLSWGEAATLAVLPNAPALIYPGKNQLKLLKKRDRLLDKLNSKNIIDQITCDLAKSEPLPQRPKSLPQIAPHLLMRIIQENGEGKRWTTTLNTAWQKRLNNITNKYYKHLKQNEIHNLAIVLIEVASGELKGYIGNTSGTDEHEGHQVDIITSPRSTGSILKPFLYAAMLTDGELLPDMLVKDVPTQIAGYAPKNFNKTYDGAVPASEALARSLNIPAVRMLQEYGTERFYAKLQKLNFSTIDKDVDHYGLSIILGGAEATLWDLVNVYAGMARTLNNFADLSARYDPTDYKAAVFTKNNHSPLKKEFKETSVFNAASIWHTFEALSALNRPAEESGWESFSSSRKVAWKTGTSFGHRDAWSVGITPEYVVGVWVGNADGEGRPGLTGVNVAAPILFDVFKLLPTTTWFKTPYDDLTAVPICKRSGHRATTICPADTQYIATSALKTPVCNYHQLVHLDKTETILVNSSCYPVTDMITKSWFLLPPIQEWYYKSVDPHYRSLPPLLPECRTYGTQQMMDLIYPQKGMAVYAPKGLSGEQEKIIFEAAHRNPNATIYWHLDETFIATTNGEHKVSLSPTPGNHLLTIVDENGNSIDRKFEVK